MTVFLILLFAFLWACFVAFVGDALSLPRWIEWTAIIVGAFLIGGWL